MSTTGAREARDRFCPTPRFASGRWRWRPGDHARWRSRTSAMPPRKDSLARRWLARSQSQRRAGPRRSGCHAGMPRAVAVCRSGRVDAGQPSTMVAEIIQPVWVGLWVVIGDRNFALGRWVPGVGTLVNDAHTRPSSPSKSLISSAIGIARTELDGPAEPSPSGCGDQRPGLRLRAQALPRRFRERWGRRVEGRLLRTKPPAAKAI